MLAGLGLAVQLYAFVTEITALNGSARVVTEVNARLGVHE
jgi:hypothetical protein